MEAVDAWTVGFITYTGICTDETLFDLLYVSRLHFTVVKMSERQHDAASLGS